MVKTIIRDALKQKGISQKELARLLGCSEPLVSHLLKGTVLPTYRRALALEQHLGIPHQKLLEQSVAA